MDTHRKARRGLRRRRRSELEEKFRRSEKNRVLGGVCGGLSECFGFNSTALRLFLVLLPIGPGGGERGMLEHLVGIPFMMLFYVFLWTFVPGSGRQGVWPDGDSIDRRVEDVFADLRAATNGVILRDWKRSVVPWLGAVVVVLAVLANSATFQSWWHVL